jgi:ligand-binding SRPBCC domain-containing protein
MVTFQSHSGIYTLEVKQFLQISLAEAWDFFSSPGNLSKITPPQMGFITTSGTPAKMYPGQIITYKVSPFPGFKTNRVTEITHVSDLSFFVDEQRFGPYRMWHHEHRFEALDKGVLMTDRVSYKLPFGIFGRIAHGLFVKTQLKQIFEYRIAAMEKKYN